MTTDDDAPAWAMATDEWVTIAEDFEHPAETGARSSFRWICRCGGRSWIGRHPLRSDAYRAAGWHTHHKHGGPCVTCDRHHDGQWCSKSP